MSFELLQKHLIKPVKPKKQSPAKVLSAPVEIPLGLYEDCPFCQRKLNKEMLEQHYFV